MKEYAVLLWPEGFFLRDSPTQVFMAIQDTMFSHVPGEFIKFQRTRIFRKAVT